MIHKIKMYFKERPKDMLCLGLYIILMSFLIAEQFHVHTLLSHPQVVRVNVKGLVDSYIHVLAQSPLSTQQTQKNIKDFSANLQRSLVILSHQEQAVVLPTQAVISGAPDETKVLVEIMKKQSVLHA